MQVVAILMLFFLVYVASEPIRYRGCGVESTAMSVSISPCNAVPVNNWMVCSLKHGMKVKVDAAILAPIDCSELETVVLANINDRMVPFPDSESNPCLHNIAPKCPLVKGRLYLYNFVFDVKKYYPTICKCCFSETVNKMVVYQKFGVMGLSVIFSILQKLKFQIFRLFILYDNCKNSSDCMNSTSLSNKTDTVFEEESLLEFLHHSLLVNNCISVLPCIFLSAWSDKHGRKLLLTLPCIGSCITDIVLTILIFVPLVSRSALLLVEAVYGIFGGTVLISIGCMCYITDATDHRLRTWFIGLYVGLLNIVPALDWIIRYYCTPLETGLTFQTLVLSAISIRIFFSLLFIIYIKKFVSESVFILGSFEGNPWMNLLTPINVSDAVSCVFRRRLDNVRSFIIVAIVIFVFYNTSLNGNLSLLPRYFRNEYKWSYKDLLVFAVIFSFSQTILLWVSTFFAHNFRTFDADLGTYGSISLAVSCLILSLGKSSWIALSGAATGIVSLLIPTSVLSILSKLIESTEIGCIYAGVGFLMLATQLISVSAYEALEKLCTEAGAPQLVFLLSFGLITFGLLFFIYLRKVIAPELLGQLDSSECLALINRKGQIEQLYT